jgi:hypothetical protein
MTNKATNNNLSTHTPKALVERFGGAAGSWLWDRFTVHYTPKHGSWLNQAEMEVSMFSASASANDGSKISPPCENRLAHGTAASIRTRPRFSGSSHADRPEEHFTTQSRGQSTSPKSCCPNGFTNTTAPSMSATPTNPGLCCTNAVSICRSTC